MEPVPQRSAVHRQGRRGRHRRRVHRPPHVRPPLLRRHPSGDRGERRPEGPQRGSDARHDHVPELLPAVRKAGRHDRYGQDRGARVPRHLRPRRRHDPDQPRRSRATTSPTSSTGPKAPSSRPSSTRSSQSTRRAARSWSARARSRRASSSRRCCARRGVECNVLNAKYHEQEAQIIKDAGQRDAVTIATNMAGRGVDIKLGDGVARTRRPAHHRHRTPRVAAHRQSAARPRRPPRRPGQHALLRRARRRVHAPLRRRPHDHIMDRVGFTDETPIEAGHPDEVDRDARRARSRTTTTRSASTVLEYDDVMNKQREVIYADRRAILGGEFATREFLMQTLARQSRRRRRSQRARERRTPTEWDLDEILNELEPIFPVQRRSRRGAREDRPRAK